MHKRSLQLAAALLLAGCAVSGAQAAESGFYAGLNVGQAKYDVSKDDLDTIIDEAFGGGLSSSSFDDSDTAFSAVFGYRFSRYLSLEATYTDLGKLQHHATGTINFGPPIGLVPLNTNIEISAKGPTLAVLGAVPVNPKFDLHARAGLFFSKTELKVSASAGGQSESDSISANSEDFFYGLGVGFNVGEHWTFGADWTTYKDVGDKDKTGEGDIRTLTVSGFYRF